MTKLIKGLSPKLEKMEIDGKNVNGPIQEGGNRHPNKFRRPFNPQQILQRDRRNHDDQKFQPLLYKASHHLVVLLKMNMRIQ